MSVHPRDKASELMGLVSVALAGLLVLALTTYNSLDPSLDVSTSSEHYLNWVGKIGAWVAGFLFKIFGLCAFLLPLPFLLVGYKKIRNRTLEYPFIKLAGFFLLVVALCSLLVLAPIPRPQRFDFVPGGVDLAFPGTIAGDCRARAACRSRHSR